MYEKFFGFSQKPFLIVPNPDFLYLTDKHQTALTYLEYGLREGNGFILLTGEIGSGKTTLIRHILHGLHQTMDVAVVFNTIVSPGELLEMVMTEFELTPVAGNKSANLDVLQQFLISKYALGRKVLLIVDEAQNLSNEVLEEIRMLSNLQSDDQMLLQIMLVGQPELQDKLANPNLAQLAQRIVVAYHLGPLGREETSRYIRYRLEKVGGNVALFSEDALESIFTASGGIPRAINIICDTALVYAYADEIPSVTGEIVEQVLADRGGFSFSGFDITQSRGAGLSVSHGDSCIGCEHRMTLLEEQVRDIRETLAVLHNKMTELEDAKKNELVQTLTDLLMRERNVTRELLVKYTKLHTEWKASQNLAQSAASNFSKSKE